MGNTEFLDEEQHYEYVKCAFEVNDNSYKNMVDIVLGQKMR